MPRAVPIGEAMVAVVLADALLEKLGGDSLEEMKATALKMVEKKFAAMDADGDGELTEKELAAKMGGGKCKCKKAAEKAPAKAAGRSKCGGGCGGCKSKK